jgi:small-conductance mechanosensitive channel
MSILLQAMPDPEAISNVLSGLDYSRSIWAAAIAVIAYFLNRVLQQTLENLSVGQSKRRMFMKKVSSIGRLLVFATATYLVLSTMLAGQERILLGLGGTLAVSIGFALKDTVSSLIAGVIILIDQPFQVGDRVQFGSTYGEVKEIGLRTVRIATLDDNEVSIPNNKFLTDEVSCGNSGALDMMIVMNFFIDVDEDFERAKAIVREACVSSPYVFLDKPVVMHVRERDRTWGYDTMIVCKSYVNDVRFESAFMTDVTERVKRGFKAHGIRSPHKMALPQAA